MAVPRPVSTKVKGTSYSRLISVEDVRNYLSHIIYILIFDFFLIFYYLSDSRFQHLRLINSGSLLHNGSFPHHLANST